MPSIPILSRCRIVIAPAESVNASNHTENPRLNLLQPPHLHACPAAIFDLATHESISISAYFGSLTALVNRLMPVSAVYASEVGINNYLFSRLGRWLHGSKQAHVSIAEERPLNFVFEASARSTRQLSGPKHRALPRCAVHPSNVRFDENSIGFRTAGFGNCLLLACVQIQSCLHACSRGLKCTPRDLVASNAT